MEQYLDNMEVAERAKLARKRFAILVGLFAAAFVFGLLFAAVVG
jgi:hypothetical protein